ncbi:MAG: tRNA lysidine(34) synthetase TilS, partial [Chloroflexi bacterium]|nr:tRNA lysidine(34) synthetase TilS [Chloroflexota bacterium]
MNTERDLVNKIRDTIHEHRLVARGDVLVVGVSGGADSLTLLHALRALAPELELKLHVAHLNHQLRGDESDADEQFVLWLAREWSLPVANARWDVRGYAEENQFSIEEAARMLRYRFLASVAQQVQANAVAVAHNADDQVETILLHFLRGAGLSGLRGMAYKSSLQLSEASGQSSVNSGQVNLVRPLLDIPRDEIETYCVENNLQPRIDETNFDTTILRNRLRHNVIPYLETINPNLRAVLRHSALSIADDYAYIRQNVLGIFDGIAHEANGALVFDKKWFRALPVNLQRGVLREAVWRLRRLKNMGYQHIEQARRVAAEKDAGAEALLPQGLLLVVGYDDFTIGEHLPLPDAPLLLRGETITLNVGDEVLLEDSDWGVRTSPPNPLSYEERGSKTSPPDPLSYEERGSKTSPPNPLSYEERGSKTSPPDPLSYEERGSKTSPPDPLSYEERGSKTSPPDPL